LTDRLNDFLAAIHAGDIALVRALLDDDSRLGSAKSEKGQTPILAAIYSGRTEIRDLLIARGVRLELHEAAAAGQLVAIQDAVEKEPGLAKGYSPDGFPVLALAAAFGHFAIVRYLHGKGADINAAANNASGYNALTGAVASGHREIAEWLLENGADPNYRYGAGYSPLLTAAANGQLEIVKALVKHGADAQATTKDGKSGVGLAEERKHPEVAAFLRGCGAA
jgi:uncharacterized protein